jgi:hypothetical protein
MVVDNVYKFMVCLCMCKFDEWAAETAGWGGGREGSVLYYPVVNGRKRNED